MQDKQKVVCIITVIAIFSIFILHQKLYKYKNIRLLPTILLPDESLLLIPNIVHYIMFNTDKITFTGYLSILSVIKVQKPTVIHFHTNSPQLIGYYWQKIKNMSLGQTIINVKQIEPPTHVYGQPLSSIFHVSDVVRIHILRTFGGIYLDTDMILINNVNSLRIYDCVIGWPKKESIGSQFIMAKNTSLFLELWQEGYRHYRSRGWYYNAGHYPTELLRNDGSLAHIEVEAFGVQYLLDKLLSTEKWNNWHGYYGVHLLSRHSDLIQGMDEKKVWNSTTNFAEIAKWVLKL